ncbi:hypothetical protein K439DRAFT_1643334, partial [Ramaria rubella]
RNDITYATHSRGSSLSSRLLNPMKDSVCGYDKDPQRRRIKIRNGVIVVGQDRRICAATAWKVHIGAHSSMFPDQRRTTC